MVSNISDLNDIVFSLSKTITTLHSRGRGQHVLKPSGGMSEYDLVAIEQLPIQLELYIRVCWVVHIFGICM